MECMVYLCYILKNIEQKQVRTTTTRNNYK